MTLDEQESVRELGDIATLLLVQVTGLRLRLSDEDSKTITAEMQPYHDRIEELLLELGV